MHGEKAQRIARGERAAKRIDARHAAEREAHVKSLEGLDAANDRFYAGLRKGKENAPEHEKAALEKQIADHKVKVKEQPEKSRAEMAARHAGEKEKAAKFLETSGSLKERLAKQTAAKHREVNRTPGKLAKQHAGAKERLETDHAEAREAMASEHREARKDVRKDQWEERQSLRGEHKEEREGLKDTHKDERQEFIEGVRQDLADHGFKKKPKEYTPPEHDRQTIDAIEHKHLESYKQSADDLSSTEKQAIDTYGGLGYSKINDALRWGSPEPDAVKGLDGAMRPTREAMTVYRGSRVLPIRSKDPKDLGKVAKDAVGHSVHDAAYMSTSLNFHQAAGFATGDKGAIFKINVPAGTNHLMPAAIKGAGEAEITLPRGGRLHITNYLGSHKGNHVYEATYHGDSQ